MSDRQVPRTKQELDELFPRVRPGVQPDSYGGTLHPPTHRKTRVDTDEVARQWSQLNPAENPKHRRGRPGEN